ncbi:hypothetical protein BU14_0357s0001 [Porphyra umbilicalis]|uniref:Thiolase N-terminal domain-containing protein n=1 Tax=Porphyra umbilicalis TaxID=2786 RepID=A0A1X6NXI3_PORUM|nr:hypothetical protein BU14_0357s0001 [Porphyra umbilicalis]|eukprot:OSX73308.1 hypothetical protein BU14_0357s0001 [Porphyra umbilicalis]
MAPGTATAAAAASTLHDVFIVSAARTPIGSFLGSLRAFPAVELASVAISGALDRTRVPSAAVSELVLGTVLAANGGQAPARQAALAAALPVTTVCTTVNKVCASGLKAVGMAADSLALGRAGAAGVAVAGGAESMSRAPHYVDGLRGSGRAAGARYGWPTVGDRVLVDAIARDGLTDATLGASMGALADALAAAEGISREEQDHHATHSYSRAAKAAHAGLFADEIVAVKAADGSVALGEDEEVRRFTSVEHLPTLRPAFAPAANGGADGGGGKRKGGGGRTTRPAAAAAAAAVAAAVAAARSRLATRRRSQTAPRRSSSPRARRSRSTGCPPWRASSRMPTRRARPRPSPPPPSPPWRRRSGGRASRRRTWTIGRSTRRLARRRWRSTGGSPSTRRASMCGGGPSRSGTQSARRARASSSPS